MGLILEPVEGVAGQYRRFGTYEQLEIDQPLFEKAFDDFNLHAKEHGIFADDEDEMLLQIILV